MRAGPSHGPGSPTRAGGRRSGLSTGLSRQRRLGPEDRARAQIRLDRIRRQPRRSRELDFVDSWRVEPFDREDRIVPTTPPSCRSTSGTPLRLCVLRTSSTSGLVMANRLRRSAERLPSSPSRDAAAASSAAIKPDPDQIERTDETVADPEAACTHDRVAKRDRPLMLDAGSERRAGVVRRSPRAHPTRRRIGERMNSAVRCGHQRRQQRPASSPSSPSMPSPIRAPIVAAELDRLILSQIARGARPRGRPSASLYTASESITRMVSLSRRRSSSVDDLAVEFRVLEAEDEELNRSNCHLDPPWSYV